MILGVDSPLFSTIVIFNNQPFPWVPEGFCRKKDPWKVTTEPAGLF